MNSIYIVEGVRTAFGNFGGSLKDTSTVQLGTSVARAALARSEIPPEDIEEVIFGNVIQTDPQSLYLGRHVGLYAGLPQHVPGLTVNRLCGSGMESVIIAASNIALGRTQTAIAGGVENMSQSPYIVQGARWGNRLGNNEIVDVLHTGLNDVYVNQPMGLTAENLAEDYSITRQDQDEWSLSSHDRARKARDRGIFQEEIVKIRVRTSNGRGDFSEDEFIRELKDLEKISSLPSAYKQGGTVTAGNASGLNDGASALILASEEYIQKSGKKPLAKILGWGQTGCDPSRMGLGPVTAIPKALGMAKLELKDMDLIEINEAFAAQVLAVKKILKLDSERLNVNGGALSLGHPLGASGNRLILTLSRELRRRSSRYGVASLCIGGGQGIAMVIESIR